MNEQRGKGEGIMTAGQNKDGGKVLRYPPVAGNKEVGTSCSGYGNCRTIYQLGRGGRAILVKEDGWNFVVDQFSTMRLFIET